MNKYKPDSNRIQYTKERKLNIQFIINSPVVEQEQVLKSNHR